jgi:hypothetical protein
VANGRGRGGDCYLGVEHTPPTLRIGFCTESGGWFVRVYSKSTQTSLPGLHLSHPFPS